MFYTGRGFIGLTPQMCNELIIDLIYKNEIEVNDLQW